MADHICRQRDFTAEYVRYEPGQPPTLTAAACDVCSARDFAARCRQCGALVRERYRTETLHSGRTRTAEVPCEGCVEDAMDEGLTEAQAREHPVMDYQDIR